MKNFVIYTTVANSFFYNLARALNHLGHTVYLLNPPLHVVKMFKNECEAKYIGSESLPLFFQEQAIDSLLLWNGSNNLFFTQCARACNVKTWFFENGYLSNTLQMNRLGVNASVAYNTNDVEELYSFAFPESDLNLSNFEIKHLDKLTLKNYLLSKLKQSKQQNTLVDFYHVFQDKLRKLLRSLVFKYGYSEPISNLMSKPYILFPLQVNDDTQIVQNSPHKDMYQILDTLAPLMVASSYHLVIKEHPEELTFTRYKKYLKYKNVHLTKQADLNSLIENAACIVTVNSSVGLQAIQKNKKVITLGDSFYNSAPGTYQCNLFSGNFLTTLEHALDQKVLPEDQSNYIQYFRDKIFIQGNWRQPDKALIEGCVNRL